MNGFIQTAVNPNKNSEIFRQNVFKDLMEIVKECQTKYGGKTELATETDSRILKLCEGWESALSHGLRTTNSVLKNVTDLVSGVNIEAPVFWDFAYQHLTAHEKERFASLRYVWTDRGKVRALIRAALNERSLERYILTWLSDPELHIFYESSALLRDDEATNLLPTMAAGLSSILFAINIDSPELNAPSRNKVIKSEPVIAVPTPNGPLKKSQPIKRQIIVFDENGFSTSPSTSGYGSMPKSLSNLCLKHVENNNNGNKRESTTTNYYNKSQVVNKEWQKEISIRTNSGDVSEITESKTLPVRISSPKEETIQNIIDNILTPPSDSGILVEAGVFDDSTVSSLQASSKTSSLRSSCSSSSSRHSADEVLHLRSRLRETEERCSWLESRVAELSLENHRLLGLTNSPRGGTTFFTVSVPRVLLQKNGKKKYYAYEVHIIPTHGGDEWTVLRRYSEFYKLNKAFQKQNAGIGALDFPPKKKFGNMDSRFVEQRRQRLQVYLRHLLTILPEVSSCTTRSHLEQVLPFFK